MSYVDVLWSPSELKRIHDEVNAWIKSELKQETEIATSWVCREVSNQISVYESGLSWHIRPRESHVAYVRERVIEKLKKDVRMSYESMLKYVSQVEEGVDPVSSAFN